MSKEDIRKRLYELYDIVEEHNRRYYVEDDPIIEDSEYDALMREIKKIEAEKAEQEKLEKERKELFNAIHLFNLKLYPRAITWTWQTISKKS